ncbi:MAG: 16S rRNA (adenine(1518)-N(6)/adenine(1519)-N(6))-dimethyltransferase RsmA [Negativicutes bacterium]|nr:16S rRNA (adenine(1518)-N(6)/adenine(1519)-N(6))-dimethyltransferase RsmA [Negativicutes bacterium]
MVNKLTSPSEIKRLIDHYRFPVRKKLGQNFLVDEHVLQMILAAAQLAKQTTVLEIGPGFGTLTVALAEQAGRVVSIEIDPMLIPILQTTFLPYPQIQLIQADALKLDFTALFAAEEAVTVAANLPYYITSPLIVRLLQAPFCLRKMVILVQKEVGDRLLAQADTLEYGSLSVFVQSTAKVELVCRAPRTVFYPSPKVDSAVIAITPDANLRDRIASMPVLELTNRAIFGQRRKTIANSLKNSPYWTVAAEDVRQVLSELEIDSHLRGEVLTPDQIVFLANALAPVVRVNELPIKKDHAYRENESDAISR